MSTELPTPTDTVIQTEPKQDIKSEEKKEEGMTKESSSGS